MSQHAAEATLCAQVSRLFSALLQLANAGNLVIVRTDNSPAQPFALQLRSLDPAHAHFSDYRAPSFLQAKVMTLHEVILLDKSHTHACIALKGADFCYLTGIMVCMHAGHQRTARRHSGGRSEGAARCSEIFGAEACQAAEGQDLTCFALLLTTDSVCNLDLDPETTHCSLNLS